MRYVFTLSSIPPRFGQIGITLRSLLRQKLPAEAIELYIPRAYRRFPDWDGTLPKVPEGVTIVRVDEDLGPATKILPAARAYRGQDIELIYVDDDVAYTPMLGRNFMQSRQALPGTAICRSGFSVDNYGFHPANRRLPRAVATAPDDPQVKFQLRRIVALLLPGVFSLGWRLSALRRVDQAGYCDVAEGYAAVMVRPDFFEDSAFDIPPVLWAVDDVWLSGMLERRGIPIWVESENYVVRLLDSAIAKDALHRAVIDGADREQANRACVEHMRNTYGIWGGTAATNT